jgi:ferric-dicitrate binding protein FerR (iron transport regulator)
MSPEQQSRLDQLIGGHLDGALDAAQVRELAELLQADGEARRTFARSLAMDTALPRVVRRRTTLRLLWPALAAAAVLAIAVGAWLLSAPAGPRLEPGSQAVVVRLGRELAADAAGALRDADRVRTADGKAVVVWPEGTRVVLGAGSRLDLVAVGPRKELYLDSGRIDVEAAVQTAGSALAVRTDRLAIAVVGTRFRVASAPGASSVAVEHGSVALSAGGTQQTVSAGQLAVSSGSQPLWISPAGQDAQALLDGAVHIDAKAFELDDGRDWRATLRDGSLVAVPEETAERVENPILLDGYTRMLPDLNIAADVTLARPGTLAVILVCRRPDGRDWLGNYSVKADLPAGRHRRAWTAADLQIEQGAAIAAANGARLVKVAVCAWPRGAGLQVHAVAIGHGAGAMR